MSVVRKAWRGICPTAGFVVFLVGWLACSAALAAEPKRVMLLHSFGRDFKPWSEYAKAIRAELDQQSPAALNVFEHSLEIARSSDDNPEGPFVEYLHALYAKQRIDLIVSIGAPAAAFVQRHRQRLFPETPMLLTVVDQRRVQYSTLTANDAVVAVAIDYFAAVHNILRVLPNTKHLTVIVGASPIEKFWKEAIGKETEFFASQIAFTWTDSLSFEDILKQAASLPPHSAIFWELMIVDAAGIVHEEGKALARLYAVANAPIFSYTDAFFGREIVGGPHVPVLEHGRKVAEVAHRILAGTKAGDIQTQPIGFSAPRFDWRELQRWGISETSLPQGSRVEFRNPTAWDEYRTQILLACAVVLAQALLIGWLIYEHRRRQFAEIEARGAMSELMQVNRIATAGELSASIAHEVAQPLAGMVASANAGLRWLKAASPNLEKVEAMLTNIVGAGHRTSEVVRSVRALFKTSSEPRRLININDFILTVLELIAHDLQKHRIKVETQLGSDLPPIIGDPIQLQQVLLNLITNAIDAMRSMESRPSLLRIRSENYLDKNVLVLVQDNGIGISAEQVDLIFKPLFTTKSHGMGIGLSICRSIITAHHGRIWASRDGDSGTVFQFVLPAARGQENEDIEQEASPTV